MGKNDENIIGCENIGGEQLTENYSINDEIMISRRERNKRNRDIKILGRKKGKRYKKRTNLLKCHVGLDINKKYGIILVSSLIAGIYIVSHIYFKYHFYLGSTINCINVSGKTIKDAEKSIKDGIEKYSLTLEGRNNSVIVIKGEDFELKYDPDKVNEIENIKENQNKSFWFQSFLKDENKDGANKLVTYNEGILNNIVDNLEFFKEENIIEPRNPEIIFENGEFHIRDEVYGNKVKKEKLKEEILKAIISGQDTLNLEETDCYENPEFTKSSEKANKIQEILNQYKNTKIVYNLGNSEEVLDMSTMSDWIDIDDDYN
ncbi:MAG: peptidoglycan binding domain-containing protein, partial [Clostridium sp.]